MRDHARSSWSGAVNLRAAALLACGALVAGWMLGGLTASAQTTSDWLVVSDADSGAGTLRWAIDAANESAGGDRIRFASAMTIRPRSPLPPLSDSGIAIDGSSGAATVDAVPRVWLDGARAGDASGLELIAARGSVRGLGVLGFERYGIGVLGADAADAEIVGNWIGLRANGGVSPNRLGGAAVLAGAADARIAQNRLGGNSVEGRTGHGIVVGGGGSVGAEIVDNVIGITADGGSAPNDDGILIVDSAQAAIRGNTIGNSKVAGIELRKTRLPSHVEGNRVGLRRDGAAAPNDVGVFLGPGSVGARIGSMGAPNIIAGNRVGIAVEQGAREAWIQGNWIGLVPPRGQQRLSARDLRQALPQAVNMPNRIRGISVIADAALIQVTDNHISAGTYGIVVDGAGTTQVSLTRNMVAGSPNGATVAAIDVRAGAEINLGGDQQFGNHVCGAEYGIRAAATEAISIRSNRIGHPAATGVTFDSNAEMRWGIYLTDGVKRAQVHENYIADVSDAAITVAGEASQDNNLSRNRFGWNALDIDLQGEANRSLSRPMITSHSVRHTGAGNYRSTFAGQAPPGSYVEIYVWRDDSWERMARSRRANQNGEWNARTAVVPSAPLRALAVTAAGSTSEFSDPFLPSQRVRLRTDERGTPFVWTGPAMSIADALGELDRWIETAWRWDAARARWIGWSPRVPDRVNGALRQVRTGDVLRLQLSGRPPREFFVPAGGALSDPETISLSAGFNNVAWLGRRVSGPDVLERLDLAGHGVETVRQWDSDAGEWRLVWPRSAGAQDPGMWELPVFWIRAERGVVLKPP